MVFSKNSLKFFYFFKKINNLKKGITQKGGRNFLGRICVYTKGSGLQKFKYRFLNFFYFYKQDYYFLNIELDKRRNSFIGLILYLTGFISYVLLPEGKNVYDGCKGFILEKFNTKISLGSWSFLNYIPLGTLLYNIELYPYKGGKYCRSAGTFSILLSKNNKNVFLKMKSKWKIIISNKCAASLGVVSNKDYKYINKKKAGVVRNFGKRMSVRGVAMNPCDHPHGGGEGKKSKKVAPRTPWGKLTVSVSTKKKIKIKLKRKKLKVF